MAILINDSTLRDGQHAVKHQLTVAQLRDYATAVDKTGVAIVEVGHGNGLGASSYQVGRAALSDETMLNTVRECLQNSKMGVFMLPGWGTVVDLAKALSCGAVRIWCGSGLIALRQPWPNVIWDGCVSAGPRRMRC